MAGKRTIISERFHLDRVGQDPGQYEALLQENEDYALTAAELIDTDHDGERIFQKVAVVNAVELAGKELSGKKGRRNRKQDTGAFVTETSKAGASGGKISGAGGGGFFMFYCPDNTRYQVITELQKLGGEFRRFRFTNLGAESWIVK